MKLGPLTKVALAGGLLLGQAQPTDNFYEDDDDFNLSSSVLSQGWNWSINKADAADECTNNESTSAEQCLEVIEVEGQYDPAGELSLEQFDPYYFEDIEPQTTTSDPIGYNILEYTEVTDCPSQAQQDYEKCHNNASEEANHSLYSCYKRHWDEPVNYDVCAQDVDKIRGTDMERCFSIKSEQLKKCP